MSGVAIGLALGAAASSGGGNNGNSSADKTYQCTQMMSNFNHKTSTVKDKQDYASCVDHLYPKLSPTDVIAMKVIIVLTFLLFVFGSLFGYKKDGGIGMLFYGVLLSGLVFFGLLLFYIGAVFVFS